MLRRIENDDLLAQCPLFAGASADDIKALAAVATMASWTAGEMIFQQGDPPDFMIVVASGRIRLALATAAGKELTIRHAGAGAVVGEMGVLDQEPRSADATAEMATTGLAIRRAPFERVLAERPELAKAIIRYLSRRLRETTFQLESVALYELAARMARFLLASLKQRHGEDLPDIVKLPLDLAQGEIAAILGASRPKLNRALAELTEQGAIKRHDKLIECHVERLQAIAEADES
jgi:CRP/FNR family transcriptional regulator, cyclic AMP receptor protein